MTEKARFSLDKQKVKRDELVEVRALLPLQMERVAGSAAATSALRRRVPKTFECKVGANKVFSAEFGPATTASAYVQFKFKARESAPVVAAWTMDDNGVIAGGEGEIRVV
jgi:hypothetical protein